MVKGQEQTSEVREEGERKQGVRKRHSPERPVSTIGQGTSLPRKRQRKNDTFLAKLIGSDDSEAYTKVTIENTEFTAINNRMVIPKSLRGPIVAWPRHYLMHPGGTQQALFVAKHGKRQTGLHKQVEKCSKKSGQLPTKEVEPPIPWTKV